MLRFAVLFAVMLVGTGWWCGDVDAELVGISTLDSSAFAADINVNGKPYQTAITTRNDAQYAAWFTANRTLLIGRRRLKPVQQWEVTALGYTFPNITFMRESRNGVSMGISPSDNRIHLVFNLAERGLSYIVSNSGLASVAGQALSWTGSRFSGVSSTLLGGVALESVLSFPQFVTTPNNGLQLFYRVGKVGYGTAAIASYDGTTNAWTALGSYSSSGGTYTTGSKSSAGPRGFLPHGAVYDQSTNLYIFGTFRESDASLMCNSGGLANHDLFFLQSNDYGRNFKTWQKSLIATTGSSSPTFGVDDVNVLADSTGIDRALLDAETTPVVTSNGYPFALLSYVPSVACSTNWANDRATKGQSFLLRRAANGFNKTAIPFPINSWTSSHLVLDSADNAYVIYNDLRVVRGSKKSTYTDWTLLADFMSELGFSNTGYSIDKSRSQTEDMVTLFFQNTKGVMAIDLKLMP